MMKPFADAEYSDADFHSLDLRDARVEGVEFQDCRFTGIHAAGAAFVRCRFLDCTFRGSDLSNASLRSTVLREVTFEDAKLLGVNWTETTGLLRPVWRRSVLTLGNFAGLDLRKAVLSECVAREVEFGHTNLAEADLRGTDFAGSRFLQTNLTKADLRGAVSYAIRPLDNILKKARFSLPEAQTLLHGLDIVLD